MQLTIERLLLTAADSEKCFNFGDALSYLVGNARKRNVKPLVQLTDNELAQVAGGFDSPKLPTDSPNPPKPTH